MQRLQRQSRRRCEQSSPNGTLHTGYEDGSFRTYVIPIASGGGELCWGRIGTFVCTHVNVANLFQDKERHLPIVVILHFAKNLILERTELML